MHDNTPLIKRKEERPIMVNLYVGDFIYTSNDEELCARFKKSVKKEFEMMDLIK